MLGTCFRLKEMWYKGGPFAFGWGLAAFGGSAWDGTPGSPGVRVCVVVWVGGKSTVWQAAEALTKVERAIILQPLTQGAFR